MRSGDTPLNLETDVQQGDWWRRWDPTNKRCYWANTKTLESSWVKPKEWVDEADTKADKEPTEKKYNTIGTDWLAIYDPKAKRTYFANAKTGTSTWIVPEELKIDWRAMTDKSGRPYYYNARTGQTTWEMPDELTAKMLEKMADGEMDGTEIDIDEKSNAPPPTPPSPSKAASTTITVTAPTMSAENEDGGKQDAYLQHMEMQARKKARAASRLYRGAELEEHKAVVAARVAAANAQNMEDNKSSEQTGQADAASTAAEAPEDDEDSEDGGDAEVVPVSSEEELKQVYQQYVDVDIRIKEIRATEAQFSFPESISSTLTELQQNLDKVIKYLHNDLDALCIGGRDNVQSLVEFGRMDWDFENKNVTDYREKAASFDFRHCMYDQWACPEILSSVPLPENLTDTECWINNPKGGAVLKIASTTTAKEAVVQAVNHFYPGQDASKYMLKAHGFKEMMHSDTKLSSFKFVRDRLISGKPKMLVIIPRPEHIVPPPMPTPKPTKIDEIPQNATIMCDVAANWSLMVKDLTNCHRDHLPMLESAISNIFVETFLFHGHEVLDGSSITTKPLDVKKVLNFNEKSVVSLQINALPRETKLCVLVYGGKGSGRVLLAWAIRSLVNQNNKLITDEDQVFKLWPVTQQDTEKREEMRLRKVAAVTQQQQLELRDKIKNKEISHTMLNRRNKKGTLKGEDMDFMNAEVSGEDLLPDYYFIFSETTRDNNRTNGVACPVLTVSFDHMELPAIYAPLVFDPPEYDAKAAGKTLNKKMMETAGMYQRYNRLINQDVLYNLVPADKQMLWMVRNELSRASRGKKAPPNILPLFLASVSWQNPHHRTEAHRVLQECARPTNIAIICDLLSHRFADYTVRSFAVDCLREIKDDDVLRQYLLQLTQCLKAELYHDSPLATFLLERAIANPLVIGHFLFWHLKAETVEPNFCERFAVLLETYILNCELSAQELRKQNNTILKLQRVAEHVAARRARNVLKKDNKATFKAELQELNDAFFSRMVGAKFQVPLFPSCEVSTLIVDSCNFMSSKMAPLWLVFKNTDPGAPPVFIMFKSGDDLRQDILTLQLLDTMNKMWLAEGLDMKMSTYAVIATGVNSENKGVGMLEIVLDSETTSGIQLSKGAGGALKSDIIDGYIKTHNQTSEQFADAKKNFMYSVAGYCIATSILGIGDRHNGNIMVKKDGCFFHIDFGHFLGNFKSKYGVKRERVPFVFTPDLAYVVGGGRRDTKEKERYKQFEELCVKAFNVLRTPANAAQLMGLFKAMTGAGMPELQQDEDIWYMKNRFQLNLKDDEAGKWFNAEANASRKSKFRLFDNFIHNKKHG